LIPSLALSRYYAYISGFEINIDKKRKELQKLELDKQKIRECQVNCVTLHS